MDKYNYLRKFINSKPSEPHRNFFGSISTKEIKEAEERLGFTFPRSLKEFWLEIGYGFLTTSIDKVKKDFSNRILYPQQIADIMLLKEESDYILLEAVEYIEEGYIKDDDIIFFEVADMSSFLVMKPSSDKPDAIYDMLGRVLEEHFERFIWRLYHESPDYYLHVHPDYFK
ncbi:SMI1/KNR4 family protein [Candidatus Tisiphia endosymbiont of Piscicola geometra]|uniref:SMI1/KNR4 family protein n=1 Tax=Candidatus Tisiphia endosymbiont of Piscicola geometra TaxID=3066273 RepID=UPI00312C8980